MIVKCTTDFKTDRKLPECLFIGGKIKSIVARITS